MNYQIVTLISTMIISYNSFAHGMNKHGPNGGYIKMPGAFHTELVDGDEKMHVYLLDMSFKNPTIDSSSVKIKYSGKSESEFACKKNIDHFVCDKPKDVLANYKEISISAIRNNNKAREAIYILPLKLEK